MPTQAVKPPYWLQTSEAAQTLAHTLLERYPAAFCAEPAGVRPLKIRIDRDIRQALEVSRQVVTEVLRRYTRRRAYREALAVPGAMRVDLDGQPVAPVTPQHQQMAQQGYRRPARQAGAMEGVDPPRAIGWHCGRGQTAFKIPIYRKGTHALYRRKKSNVVDLLDECLLQAHVSRTLGP